MNTIIKFVMKHGIEAMLCIVIGIGIADEVYIRKLKKLLKTRGEYVEELISMCDDLIDNNKTLLSYNDELINELEDMMQIIENKKES